MVDKDLQGRIEVLQGRIEVLQGEIEVLQGEKEVERRAKAELRMETLEKENGYCDLLQNGEARATNNSTTSMTCPYTSF